MSTIYTVRAIGFCSTELRVRAEITGDLAIIKEAMAYCRDSGNMPSFSASSMKLGCFKSHQGQRVGVHVVDVKDLYKHFWKLHLDEQRDRFYD